MRRHATPKYVLHQSMMHSLMQWGLVKNEIPKHRVRTLARMRANESYISHHKEIATCRCHKGTGSTVGRDWFSCPGPTVRAYWACKRMQKAKCEDGAATDCLISLLAIDYKCVVPLQVFAKHSPDNGNRRS